jgi:hypothetical protein
MYKYCIAPFFGVLLLVGSVISAPFNPKRIDGDFSDWDYTVEQFSADDGNNWWIIMGFHLLISDLGGLAGITQTFTLESQETKLEKIPILMKDELYSYILTQIHNPIHFRVR